MNKETDRLAAMEIKDIHLLTEYPAEIGARLRLRRRLRGMSLKDVATKAHLSVGMVSQVERGQASPSIRSLRAICDALEMPVIWLFERHDEQQSIDRDIIVRRANRRVLNYGNNALHKEILTPDTQPQIQMLRFLLEPNADSGEPYNNSEGGKCGLVLSGTLGLELDSRQFIVETGDSFAFPAEAMVRFWTIGDQACEVIWVVAPATV